MKVDMTLDKETKPNPTIHIPLFSYITIGFLKLPAHKRNLTYFLKGFQVAKKEKRKE